MKIVSKISLLSLLAVAAFVPQQSQAVITKQLLLFGAGIAVIGLIGYEYLSTHEINDTSESTISKEEETSEKAVINDRDMFKLENCDYNNKDKDLPAIFWLKNTFTAQEYAKKLKELIEDDTQALLALDHIFWIINQKKLIKNILEHTFTTETDEEKTLLQISQDTWAEETITAHYQNHFLEEKKLYHEHLLSLIAIKKEKQLNNNN